MKNSEAFSSVLEPFPNALFGEKTVTVSAITEVLNALKDTDSKRLNSR